MNELEMLRALRDTDTAPPRPEARASARRALLEAAADPTPRRSRRPWTLAGAGLVTAAGIAVALALVTGIETGRVALEPARAALERAAVAAEDGALDVGPGQFLYIRERDAYLGTVGDSPPYSTLTPHIRETWVGRDGAGRIVSRRGKLIFPGPRDRARWRAAGAPPLVGAPHEEYEHGASRFTVGSSSLTYAELADLPTDGRAMYERLIELAGNAGPSPDGEVFVIIGDLLRGAPVPAHVRAALYRAVAYIEGIRFAGTVTDGQGRRGLAVDLLSDHGTRNRLVFDPSSSALLAEEEVLTERVLYVDAAPGFVVGSRLVLETGVVDSDTARPRS